MSGDTRTPLRHRREHRPLRPEPTQAHPPVRPALAAWLLLLGGLLVAGPENSPRPAVHPLEVVAALATIGVVVLLPWPALVLRRVVRQMLPIAAILVVIPVELLPGWDMHYGVVLALPLLWAALEAERRLLIAGLLSVVVVCAFPSLLTWTVPPSLVFDAVTISVSALAAFTVGAFVTRARDHERELLIAFTDTLTGLPNRQAWETLLAGLLDTARSRQSPITVAVIDLDGFGDYNDDWGHQAGDRLLQAVAGAWRPALRELDLLARCGDDEFALALPGCHPEQAEALLRRLNAVSPRGTTFSAGIVGWDASEDADQFTRRALAALDDAKHSPTRTSLRVVTGASSGDSWEAVVPQLVQSESIEAVYQAIVRAADRGVTGYEALARPAGAGAELPVDGMFSAARRLALSGQLELICIRAAVRGARLLPAEIDLFINIAAGSLRDPDLMMSELNGLLAEVGRDCSSVVLEVSEALSRMSRFSSAFAQLRAAGFRIALDDVGEGKTTIDSLIVVQPAFIKLGRSLVLSRASAGSAATIHAMVEYARFTSAEVIAEGVEREADCDSLVDLGVTYFQGYALGRPARLSRAAGFAGQPAA